ncbi:cyclic nucleotide-binding domain-containing protein [Ottowia testudinis]|uniref:Cyclic nucleotide-binding domain-containing protein n=1 Tax=Ottowia testudinis TaxID=2816950 RepID=A0A975CI38_9BURK|nr:cyclic nucleotide-binding domain-containing protein [Ottowia testudinis]QTD45352.1 cyclic nucleotide-binding domain-containing protein [Ottowia testudinis]
MDHSTSGSNGLRGLIDATRFGGAYDALPCRLDGPQWECLAPYLQPYPACTGHMPIRQGDKDRTLFFIESGTLTVHLEDAAGRMKLAVLAPGTVVGEGAFFSGQARNATVVATRDSMLWALKLARFQELSVRQPAIALELSLACAAVVVRRLNHTTMRVAVT